MTATIRITAEDLGIAAALRRVEAAAGDLSDLMDMVGAQIEDAVAGRFEEGRGPDGSPWKPSLGAAVEGRPTLVASARLRDSVTREVGPGHVDVGTNVIYAAIHQFGGEIRPRSAPALAFRLADGRFVRAGKVTIPARPYLGFGPEDETAIARISERFFARLWA